MDINKIKRDIQHEVDRGNLKPFKVLRSFTNKVYRNLNKDKVKVYNARYLEKKKHTSKNKKHTSKMEDILG